MIFQMLMPLLTPDVVALLVSQFSHALMPDLTAFSIPDLAPSSRPAWIPSLAAFLSATAQMLGGLPVMTLMLIPAQIIGGLLLADFISGLFHWFEDRYGNPDWPVLGHTIRQNQQHHFTPALISCGHDMDAQPGSLRDWRALPDRLCTSRVAERLLDQRGRLWHVRQRDPRCRASQPQGEWAHHHGLAKDRPLAVPCRARCASPQSQGQPLLRDDEFHEPIAGAGAFLPRHRSADPGNLRPPAARG